VGDNVGSDKLLRLEILWDEWSTCRKCPLYRNRRKPVRGTGNADAPIAFVFARPSLDAEDEGCFSDSPEEMFLVETLQALGADPQKFWYANCLACPATFHNGRRKDIADSGKDAHVKACSSRLRKELHIIQPDVIVALGRQPLVSLIPKKTPGYKHGRGRFFEAQIEGDLITYPIPVIVTHPPHDLVRTMDASPGGLWNQFHDHIKQALELSNNLRKLRGGNYVNA
jgi:DNA polymerase